MAEPESPKGKKSPISALMHGLSRLMPADAASENRAAVRMFARMLALREGLNPARWARVAAARARRKAAWPVSPGAYVVGDPAGCVAVCTLTSAELVQPLADLPGVAIAGRVYTPNLGIEKIIVNVTANPNIRFLVVCGKESPVCLVGQALQNLFEKGISAEKRIIDAEGHYPVLVNLAAERIERFRKQVEFIDCTNITGPAGLPAALAETIRAAALRNPGPYAGGVVEELAGQVNDADADSQFKPLRPGGRRQPVVYDPKGFIIISVDTVREEIVVRHYLPDHTPAHLMRGRTAEPILLGLIRAGLVTELNHAGYLGVELTKAEMGLKMGKRYEQDKPLK